MTTLKSVRTVIIVLITLILSMFMLVSLATGTWMLELITHLLAGFVFFLQENTSRLVTNSAIWIPSMTALLISLLVIHLLARSWSSKTGKPWPKSNTLCLGLITPTLFAIAFILPGAILQLKMLSQSKLTNHDGSADRSSTIMHTRNAGQAIFGLVAVHQLDRFPDALRPALDEYLSPFSLYPVQQRSSLPREPFIYLGAGLKPDQECELPLIISPAFLHQKKLRRCVYTTSGNHFEIDELDLDSYINQSLEARKKIEATQPSTD